MASLPWYDLAEVQSGNDAFWQVMSEMLSARGLAGVPAALARSHSYETQWNSPRLLLSQACGYDVAVTRASTLRVIATPCFAIEGCAQGRYWSHVLLRADDPASSLEALQGRRVVINSYASYSGYHALRGAIAPYASGEPFFSSILVSGSHEASIEHVRMGLADVAAIDCVTHELLRQHRPAWLTGTRTLMRTAPAAAPPYVTSRTLSEPVYETVKNIILELKRHDRLRRAANNILIEDFVVLPDDAYALLATA